MTHEHTTESIGAVGDQDIRACTGCGEEVEGELVVQADAARHLRGLVAEWDETVAAYDEPATDYTEIDEARHTTALDIAEAIVDIIHDERS